MTPDEYLDGLGQLVAEGRDRDALDFAAQFQSTVQPPLTFDQLDRVGGTLEGSAMAVAMLDAKAREAASVEVSSAEEPARRG